MSSIFEESNMLWVLKNYIPEGENFSAGVHGITLQVNKKKTSRFDVYVGITENYLIVVECEERTYLSERYNIKDKRSTVADDIGTCFLFEDIKSCEIKKGIMGAVNCSITFMDGGFLKLQLPKLAGLGGGMPHHAEYREKIITRLSSLDGNK